MIWNGVIHAGISWPAVVLVLIGLGLVILALVMCYLLRLLYRSIQEDRRRKAFLRHIPGLMESAAQNRKKAVSSSGMMEEVGRTASGNQSLVAKWLAVEILLQQQTENVCIRKELEKIYWLLDEGEYTYQDLGIEVQPFKEFLAWYKENYPSEMEVTAGKS
jgi:hypothetical protein